MGIKAFYWACLSKHETTALQIQDGDKHFDMILGFL